MTQCHHGSCLCGAVTYEVKGEFERFYLCHCRYCQKDTGSAHAANLFSASATLEWLSGEQHISHFNLPDTRHSKSFCRTCGSALPNVLGGGKLIMVPAGSLDDEVSNKPTVHLFMASKANWDNDLEQVPKVGGFPG